MKIHPNGWEFCDLNGGLLTKYLVIMGRKLVVATAFMCVILQGLAGEKIDSLLSLLPSQIPDSAKVWLYKDIASAYTQSEPEMALKYADSALTLARQLSFRYGEARSMYSLAMAYDYAGKTDKSISTFDEARTIFTELGDDVYAANCTNSMGVTYYFAGDQNKALEKYLEALEQWEKLDHKEHASQTLNNIGVIYRMQLKYEKALEIYEKSAKLKMALDDQLGLANTYSNMGIAYSFLGEEEQSVEYNSKAISLFESLRALDHLATAYGSLGSSYYKLKQFELAEENLAKSLKLAEAPDNDSFKELPIIRLIMAKVKNELGKAEEAVYFADLAIASMDVNAEVSNASDAYLERAKGLASQKKFEEAYSSMVSHLELNASLNEKARVEEMEKMQAQFDVKQHEQELQISELKLADNERRQTMFSWGLVLAIVLLILAGLMVLGKVRHNRRLSDKNAIIQKSLEDKEVLLKEIHHRVKNNLQVISSLLSIQSREIEDPVALQAVNESRNRVKSMAIIHQDLYKEDNLMGIDVGDYVEKLSQSLFSSYRIDEDTVTLATEIDHLNLDVDTIIPLGLILNELITNALKYAFVGRNEGRLEVNLKERADHLELTVKDDGVGFSQDQLLKKDSFGMKMMKAFAQKLDAQWEVTGENGTAVSLKIYRYKKAS